VPAAVDDLFARRGVLAILSSATEVRAVM